MLSASSPKDSNWDNNTATNINDIIIFHFGLTAVPVNLFRKGAFAIYAKPYPPRVAISRRFRDEKLCRRLD